MRHVHACRMSRKITDAQEVASLSTGQPFHLHGTRTAISPTWHKQVDLVTVSACGRRHDCFPAQYETIGNGSLQNGFCHVNAV